MYDETKLKGVGARIRNLRAEQELTQFELAEKIGVSQTHLSNIECGRVQISLKLLLRIANVLELSLIHIYLDLSADFSEPVAALTACQFFLIDLRITGSPICPVFFINFK